ncbi:hypothetical protein F5Y11DRAFT_161312 [Daldinia sp. FL1419]|nr:hypothetical protein F5Y11DRAFT_161312 [Daldinia sp. FL1419]
MIDMQTLTARFPHFCSARRPQAASRPALSSPITHNLSPQTRPAGHKPSQRRMRYGRGSILNLAHMTRNFNRQIFPRCLTFILLVSHCYPATDRPYAQPFNFKNSIIAHFYLVSVALLMLVDANRCREERVKTGLRDGDMESCH